MHYFAGDNIWVLQAKERAVEQSCPLLREQEHDQSVQEASSIARRHDIHASRLNSLMVTISKNTKPCSKSVIGFQGLRAGMLLKLCKCFLGEKEIKGFK